MAMDERDRIDIIATLHDRFNRPADEIIRKMERMESQAEDTGDSIDEMSDSLDKETRSSRESTKSIDENIKSRDRHEKSIDDQSVALAESTRRLHANTDAVSDSIAPHRKAAEAHKEAAQATEGHTKAVKGSREAQDAANVSTRESSRLLDVNSRSARTARDAMDRMTAATDKSTESLKKSTQATKQARDERGRYTKATQDDAKAWDKWNTKVKKITSSIGGSLRPVSGFFQNYFQILGAFRSMLFSDIGSVIPQLITGIVSLGGAINASLAPLGRLVGNLGQIAPLIAAFAQTKIVFGFVKQGVSDALEVLNDTNATLEDLNKAQKELGDNTWNTAKALKQIGENFAPIKKAVRETFLEGMAPALGSLTDTYFPLLRSELTRTAEIMNGELREGIKGLQTPEKQGTIADVMERSSVASGLFVDIAWSLLDVFIELADAAGPAFLDSLEAIDGILDRFAGWIRDNKDGLTDFFNRANDTAGNFFKGIGYILLGLSGIAGAAKPLEDFLYGGLLDRLKGWSEAMNDPEAQAEMTERYEAMIPNLEAIGNLIGAILDGFKTVGESEYFAPLINDLAENTIPLIFEYIKKLDETVGPPLQRIGEALSEMDPDVLTGILNPLGDALGALAWALELVVPLFSALPRPMQDMVMYGAGLAAMGLPGMFMLLLGPLRWIDVILKSFTDKGLLARVKDGFDKLKDSFGKFKDTKLGKFLTNVGKKFKDFFKPVGEFLKKFVPKSGGGGILARIFGKVAGKGVLAAIPVIGTIIGVLWLLWDVIAWLWNNVEPFRDFITGIWDWIVEAWKASIDWIVNSAVPWVVGAFEAIWDKIVEIGQGIADFYNKWIKPVVDAFIWLGKIIFVTVGTIAIIIGGIIGWIWNNVLWPFLKWFWSGVAMGIWETLKWIGSGFVWLWEGLKLVWSGIAAGAQWLWDQISAGAQWLWGALQWAWGGIVAGAQWLWDGLKWVWDGIAAGFQWLWGALQWVWSGIVTGFYWVRDSLAAAWTWIKDVIITPVVNWFMLWVWPMIKWVIDGLVGAFNWLKDRVSAVWNWIKDVAIAPTTNWFQTTVWPIISSVIGWLVDKFNWLRDRVSSAWDWIKDKIYNVYTDHISPTIEKFKAIIGTLKDSFDVAKDAIGKAWDTIKNKAKEPVSFVIDKVYNEGILPVWNRLAAAVKLDTRLEPVKWAEKGYDTGGYTGAGSKYEPAGVVHADEFVIKKTSQRSLRREAPGFLDALNKHGARALSGMGFGYAGGRKVLNSWQSISRIPHEGMTITSTTRPGARTAGTGSVSKHAQGLAVDFAGAAGAMKKFFNFVRNNYSVSELIHTPMGGRQLSRGGIPRANFPSATARSHSNHVHVGGWGPGEKQGAGAFAGASTTGSASADGWGWINPFEGLKEKFLGALPGMGGFKDIASRSISTLVTAVKDYAWDHLNPMDNIQEFASDAATGMRDFGRSASTARWAGVARRALEHTGQWSETNFQSLMRRMRQESSGRQYAINNSDSNARRGTPSKGLMQVIDPTFRAHRDKSLSSDIYDPMANIVASINYARSRYGSLTSAYDRAGGYYTGGLVDHLRFMGGPVETWGNTLVGEFGPEIFMPSDGGSPSLLGLTGPEMISFDRDGAILPHQAVAALSTVSPAQEHGGDTHTGDVINIGDITVTGNGTPQDVKAAVAEALREHDRKRKERR